MNKLNKTLQMSSASIPTIRRLPSYLYLVRKAKEDGVEIISGTVIANELDLTFEHEVAGMAFGKVNDAWESPASIDTG